MAAMFLILIPFIGDQKLIWIAIAMTALCAGLAILTEILAIKK
ncbi:hypothetical protein [Fructilactobacillus fructivorans]|nr:hypothetical protein [Fructilactobacillus fructivorans]